MIGRRARRIAAAFAISLALVASAAAQGGGGLASVHISATSKAHGERITLGDVAEIESRDSALADRLRAISLGYAPSVGSTREIPYDRIVTLVAAAVPEGGVYVEGPETSIVQRDAQTIDLSILREAVEREALGGLTSAGATARLVRFDVPERVEIPSGKVEARASLVGVRDLMSPFSIAIELRVDGQVVRRVSATAQVEAFAPVLVATRDIAARGRVRREDVSTEVRRLDKSMSAYVHDELQLRGVAAVRPIHAGEILMSDALVGAIVVKQGDAVRIVGEAPNVVVSATGEARAAGRIGDRIVVKNIQSGLTLQAVVTGDGAVKVLF